MALIFLNRVRTCILSQLNGKDRRGLCSLDQGRRIRSDLEIGLRNKSQNCSLLYRNRFVFVQ